MSIERTELANVEYRAKTGEALRDNAKIALAELGARMAQACAAGDIETVEIIKNYWRTRQTWRTQ